MSGVSSAIVAVSWLVTGCSVGRMLPSGPVLSAASRAAAFEQRSASGVAYTTTATGPPVVPFLVFGVTYDVDIVLQSRHPDWDMHEYARIATPSGPLWLAKDSRASDGDQLLVADVEDLDAWLPEIPLSRRSAPVVVRDESTEDRLDVEIRYTNHSDEEVEVRYVGPWPKSAQRKRNGSTMGHSRGQVLAVLDLSHRDFAKHASMKIGGEPYKIARVLGVLPMQLVLRQTQGGIAAARFSWRAAEGGLVTTHTMPSGAKPEAHWTLDTYDEFTEARQQAPLRDLLYHYVRTDDGALELDHAAVRPWNSDRTNFAIHFAPRLPDLRRSFDGEWEGRWVMDIGDRRSHAVGRVRVAWAEGDATVSIEADEPWWAAERRVVSTVRPATGMVETSVGPRDP